MKPLVDYAPFRMKPVVRFRLYPEASNGLYVLVNVWPTAAAMRRYAKTSGSQESAGRGVHGYCAGYRVVRVRPGRPHRTEPVVGEVNLHARRLGMEVVTHELFHATMQWARRIRFDFTQLGAEDAVNEDEERLTYAHGRLCRAFVTRATQAGLYADRHSALLT